MSQSQFVFLPVTELNTKISWCHFSRTTLPINSLKKHCNRCSRHVYKICPSDVSSNPFFFPCDLCSQIYMNFTMWIFYKTVVGVDYLGIIQTEIWGWFELQPLGGAGEGENPKTNRERINSLTTKTGKMLVLHQELHHHFLLIVEIINKVPNFS